MMKMNLQGSVVWDNYLSSSLLVKTAELKCFCQKDEDKNIMRINWVILICGLLSENAIRPFTVGRKNWLFCDTPNGAQASALVYSMVEIAKANGVNVYHYLTYLLEKMPSNRMSDEELELLAPWNENVKTEIQHRVNNTDQSDVNCQGTPATEK